MLYLRDILGQDQAIRQIRQAGQADRLPHGMIFAGAAGVGKATTAQALAAWFLCEKPGKDDACGQCHSCHLVASGTHPDYRVIYRQLIRLTRKDSKARDLSIDLIRDYLLEPAGRKALQGRGKVFIIEEAETMTRDAANSMLKTLEEPLGRTLIILLTDSPNSLLPTILSRTQIVRFAHLPQELVVHQLTRRGIDAQLAQYASIMAEGSLGLAARWIEDGVVQRGVQLYQAIDQILAYRPVEGLAAWFAESAGMYAAKQEERDENVSKDQATREGVVLYFRLAADYLRQCLGRMGDPLQQLSACQMIDDLAQAQVYVEGNVNTSLVLENVANRLR